MTDPNDSSDGGRSESSDDEPTSAGVPSSASSAPESGSGVGETYLRDEFDVAYEEARRVVEYQLDSVSDIDSKAAHTLRVLFVLFGLLITAISIVVKAVLERQGTDIATAKQFINTFTSVGVLRGRIA